MASGTRESRTPERGGDAVRSAQKHVERVEKARARSATIAERARRGLDRLTHRNGSTS